MNHQLSTLTPHEAFLTALHNPNTPVLAKEPDSAILRRLKIHFHSRAGEIPLASLSQEKMAELEPLLTPFTFFSLSLEEAKMPGFVKWFMSPVRIDAVAEDARMRAIDSAMELLHIDVYDEAGVLNPKLVDARMNVAKTLLEATKEAPRTMPAYQASVTNNFLGLPAGSERMLKRVHVEDLNDDLRRLQEVTSGDAEFTDSGRGKGHEE